MVFSSTIFLFLFLPVSLGGYYIARGSIKNYWLLFVSLVFFAWSQPNYLWLILVSILVNYCGAMLIDDLNRLRKPALVVTLAINLGLLFYFKYFDFMVTSINSVFHSTFQVADIVLPIGISFFTFQGIAYVVDVYRKDVPVQRNILKVGLYIALFPQLIAGPIVRYKDISKEIDSRAFSLDDFSDGIERFIIGLSKKAIIANTMALMVDTVWESGSGNHSWSVAWAASIAYMLQIYFDFSGYSDMAIGLGRMFGFHFNENFNLPYISKSITEFWRRWHISLSSWFRDYVYIPLGGNRKRVYLNLAIVFLLTGIWHGASWNFVVWGCWNGVFILIERFHKNRHKAGRHNRSSIFGNVLGHVYTLLIVNFGWVLFRAPLTEDAFQFIKCMFGMSESTITDNSVFWYMDRWTIFVMLAGILLSSGIPSKMNAILKQKVNEKLYLTIRYCLLILLFLFAVMRVVAGTYNPFIYYQF